MIQTKLNTFFSTLNIVLVIIGYQFTTSLLSSFMPEAEASRLVTVPYRAFALLICLITIFLNYKSTFKLNVVVKVLLVFWLLLLIRFFYDMYFRIDVFVYSDKKLQILLYMIPITIIPMYSVMKSYRVIDFKKLFFWTYVLAAITTLYIYISNQSFQEATNERLDANFALNSISSGHFGLLMLILSFFFIIRLGPSLTKRVIIIIIVGFSLIIMLRSGSRGPLLALIGVLAVWLIGASKKKAQNLIILFLISIIGYLSLEYIMQAINNISPVLFDRFEYRASTGQFEDRNPLYIYAFNSFLESPLIGKNFGIYSSLNEMAYAHNLFLDSIMQLGIIGGLMIIYIVWKTIIKIINLIKFKSDYFWIGLILMQEIMSIMVSGSIYTNPTLSILIVLLFMSSDSDNYSLQRLQK